MLRFYYNPSYKYTNRQIITISESEPYRDIDYANIDSPDTINGHIIYTLNAGEIIPTYILDLESQRRWFVSGITQLRTGKFQISLLRDIVSENPQLWSQEQAFVSAGTPNDYNKYKKWDLPFTNTKIKEERLNINGKSSFFVFYVNEQNFNNNIVSEENLKISAASVPGYTNFDYTVDTLNEIPNYEYVNAGNVRFYPKTGFRYNIQFARSTPTPNPVSGGWQYTTINTVYSYSNENPNALTLTSSDTETYYLDQIIIPILQNSFENNTNNQKLDTKDIGVRFLTNWLSTQGPQISQNAISALEAYVGKSIYSQQTNKVYTIQKSVTQRTIEGILDSQDKLELYNSLLGVNWDFPSNLHTLSERGNYFKMTAVQQTYKYTLKELGTATSFNFTFIADQRKLPKSAVRCVNIVSGEEISDNEVAQSLMLAQTNGINENNQLGRILDIQFLPFSIATTTNENIMINGQPMIAQFLDFDDYQFQTTLPRLVNINKECDSIKIVSPSRASQYLFNPYNSDGLMVFDTKITLKPYSSVIYIRPTTKGLLLADWDDKDCLTILEDFSLTNVSSEWTNYIYTNRSYQNAFERDIQGREYSRNWERRVEKAQAKSDEWTARNISSQKARTYTGNIPIVSGIAAATASAIADRDYMQAAQLDRDMNEALYQESISISRDLFNMQLDNIKSQPNIPSKITTIDCKFLDGVYIEYYSTNSTELAAIEKFYKYNGNRIDDYGTFRLYWGNFVRGKIIISLNYTQPEINELNRRLELGIFTTKIA